MIKVIAFDPGTTTGFATGEINDDGLMQVQTAQAAFTHEELFNYLNELKPDHIVCESFEYRNAARTGLVLESRELIGIIELYTQLNKSTCDLKMQTPAQVLGKGAYFNDAKLKLSGIYRRGQVHANEASKHLLYWYKFGPGYQYNKKGFKLKEMMVDCQEPERSSLVDGTKENPAGE